MAQRGSEGLGNRMNSGQESGKVRNGSEGVKGGGVLNVTVTSTTLQTDMCVLNFVK